MRVLKEVLVLAVIVLVLAYAARELEGVDAGEIDAGVPSLSRLLKQVLSDADGSEPTSPSEPSGLNK